LRDTAYEYARDERVFPHFVKGKSVRRLKYTPHFAHFIVIHVHSFIRINDHKLLRHKHVKIREKDGRRFLEIFPPSSKTSDRSSVSNQEAVEAYEKLLTEDKARGFGRPEDFVFYPEFRKRDYALSVMRRLFLQLCKNLGLQQDERGRNRTLYSLRHTAIMLRYLYGGPLVDLVEFAGNALTSVAMLEKFYLSHARNKFKVCQIQATSELYYSKGLDVQASNSVVPKGTCRFEYLQPRNDRR
jgi:integrase